MRAPFRDAEIWTARNYNPLFGVVLSLRMPLAFMVTLSPERGAIFE